MTNGKDEVVIDKMILMDIKGWLVSLYNFYTKLKNEYQEIEPYLIIGNIVISKLIDEIDNILKK
jgi:hypothetical protein